VGGEGNEINMKDFKQNIKKGYQNQPEHPLTSKVP